MNNNNIGRISMKTGNLPRKPFPLSADVYTSCGFGEVQPVLFTKCEPNTKSVLSHDVLVRLAPLLAPTRTRVGVRLTSKFVSMSDLTENFSFLMADRAVARADKSFVPKKLPCMTLQKLSMMCLIGAKISISHIVSSSGDSTDYSKWYCYKVPQDYSSLSTAFTSFASTLCDLSGTVDATTLNNNDLFTTSPTVAMTQPFMTAGTRGYLNVYRLFGLTPSIHGQLWLPVLAPSFFDFFTYDGAGDGVCDTYEVDPRGADFVIPLKLTSSSDSTGKMFALCVKLSAFGERLRKAMLGVGYELDFYSTQPKSLMPLFAVWKAWYDSYAPQLYENYTQSYLYQLLFYYEKDNKFDFGADLRSTGSANQLAFSQKLLRFFVDLGNMWYTKEQDVVTAHIRSLAVDAGGEISRSLKDYMSLPNSPSGGTVVSINPSTLAEPVSPDFQNGHSYINGGMSFSQFDLEILKKAYQVVNRNTIAGQRIAEILKANGLGKYVDECKSSFIGETWVNIDVNDVNATADSFNNDTQQGSTLGAYVGKGVGYENGKTFTYENDEYGYLITLACVVPDSGYVQQEAPWVNSIAREDFYLPDYDGKGFEANSKRILCGQIDFYDYSEQHELEKTFGFAPRMTRHKMSIGRLNGNFSLRSNRDALLPYTLDEFIAIGERDVVDGAETSEYKRFDTNKGFKPSMLPCATPNLRYVGRMKWLGHFDRIFNLENRPSPLVYNALNLAEGSDDGLFVWFELTHQTYDNFALFVNNNLKQYSGMLPMEDSFETREDGTKGATDTSIGKA